MQNGDAEVLDKVDAVTVGGGWTSTILGWKLGEAGINTVAIEQGPGRWTNPGFQHNHDALRFHKRHAMMVNLRRETWTWRPNPGAPSLPMRQYGSFNPGYGLGGSAVHWTAQLWRFHPIDFRLRSHIIENYGEDKLPEGSNIVDWPVTYDELEPYYSEFEWDIGASGEAGNLDGEIQPGGNPFEGFRSKPYPNPPLAVTIPSLMFEEAAREMGYHPFPFASGIASRAFVDRFGNPRAACLYCGYCTRYGCEVDAKASPITTHLPAALRTGNYVVRPNARVTRIEYDGDGRATGLRYTDNEGRAFIQPADMVFLTGFTLTNVRLMLLSRGGAHPEGVGNDRGQVGRNYTYQHFASPVTGYFPDRRFNLYMGNGTTGKAMWDYYGMIWDHSEVPFIGGAQIWGTLGERDPVTTIGGLVPIEGGQNWGQEWKDKIPGQWNGFADLVQEGPSYPYEDQFLDLDPVYTAVDGQPLLRLTFDWHENDYEMYRFIVARMEEIMEAMGPSEMSVQSELDPYNIHQYRSTHPTGGASMGTSPETSVTNSYGQVWDTPNLFVTGAALFPQNPGANPTDTVAALAYRTGDAIIDRYLGNEGRLIE